MTPYLTVGIPVYNGMPYLRETMDSLQRQSFKDFHILVIDDGSTDDSLHFLRTLCDPRLRVISQENCGLTFTLNRMLDEVSTPWLVRQDADDFAFPERLDRIREYIHRFPDAGMFYSEAVHYQNGKSLTKLLTTAARPERLRELTQEGHLLSICHPAAVLRVDKVRAIGGYRFDLHVEDFDMYWRMALAYDIRYIPDVLVGYRMNANSVSATNIRKQAVNVLWVQYLLLSHILGKQALRYEDVVDSLDTLVDQGALGFRTHMREALAALGGHRYARFVASAIKALVSSPGAFAKRTLNATRSKQEVVLGANPGEFLARKDTFWPKCAVDGDRDDDLNCNSA